MVMKTRNKKKVLLSKENAESFKYRRAMVG